MFGQYLRLKGADETRPPRATANPGTHRHPDMPCFLAGFAGLGVLSRDGFVRPQATQINMVQFTRKGQSMKVAYRTSASIALRFLIAVLPVAARTATPPETILAPGLGQPVEIVKDHWGIAHIYAKNEADLFFAQGYNVARDRLFQLEMWRRQATGTLAEILGRQEVPRDIGNRLFMFRGDMHRELDWYHPRGAAIIGAFVNGIDAYIAETERNPALLTPEFKTFQRPGRKRRPGVEYGLGHRGDRHRQGQGH
jgi:hypothetical protein